MVPMISSVNPLQDRKIPKDKLKAQLQKIAMKRTGGDKTDEILGNDGSGPEGLPHSIIVTPEGTEGDAPVLPGDERNDVAPSEELPLDVEESQAATRPKKKAESAKSTKAAKRS